MHRIIPALLAAAVLLAVLLSAVFVVDQRQYAVVYSLGEIRHVIDKSGLHFKWPPPFQNVVYFVKRILTLDTAEVDRFITSEKLNLQIDTFIKWQIVEPKSFIRSVQGSQGVAADRISRSLRDALAGRRNPRQPNREKSGTRRGAAAACPPMRADAGADSRGRPCRDRPRP